MNLSLRQVVDDKLPHGRNKFIETNGEGWIREKGVREGSKPAIDISATHCTAQLVTTKLSQPTHT